MKALGAVVAACCFVLSGRGSITVNLSATVDGGADYFGSGYVGVRVSGNGYSQSGTIPASSGGGSGVVTLPDVPGLGSYSVSVDAGAGYCAYVNPCACPQTVTLGPGGSLTVVIHAFTGHYFCNSAYTSYSETVSGGGGGAVTTNYWASSTYTNTSALIQSVAWSLLTPDGKITPLTANEVVPGQTATVTVTNNGPFALVWNAGDVNGSLTAQSYTVSGSGVTSPVPTGGVGAAPPDPVGVLTPVPGLGGLTNQTSDQNTRAGFNGLLVQGEQGQLQTHQDLLAIQNALTNAGTGNLGPLLQAIKSAVDTNGAAEIGTLNSNAAGLEGFLTNRGTAAQGVDSNGLVTALETGDRGFNTAMTGKLGPIPTWGSAAPSYVLPFSHLGVDGLADAHWDFGQTGFESVVPVVRGFLLFLVSVAGVFAGYRILRSFDPS